MSLAVDGLRKRSPNPNSPNLEDIEVPSPTQPYSPALLSPYAHDDSHRPPASLTPHSPASLYTPYVGPTPTIRLISPHSSSGGHATPTRSPSPVTLASRSRSDDPRRSPPSSSTTDLHRHATEPAYDRLHRESDLARPQLLSRAARDKPVPPLAHELERGRSNGSTATWLSDLDRSDDGSAADADSVDVASAGTGRTTWSSLLINPFKHAQSPHDENRPSHPHMTWSLTSSKKLRPLHLLSRPMLKQRSSGTMSTNATIAHSASPAVQLKRLNSGSTAISSEILERVRSAGGDKLTAKFPERQDDRDETWTSFKMILLMSVLTVFGYGLACLCWALQIMLRISLLSDITMVSDPDIVTFLLFFSLLSLFTSFVGLTGTLLSSRPILAFYNLLLWPTFISLALIGYTSFKRGNLQLDRKLNQVWSQYLSDEDRLRIQNGLGCCGYYNPFHDATYSKKCYPRTSLPGCKAKWTHFEALALRSFATAAFSTIPIHIVNIVIALLCSNHVDRQFGKGLTPIQYRLRISDVHDNAQAAMVTSPPAHARSSSSVSSAVPLLPRTSPLRSSRGSSRSSSSTIRLVKSHERHHSLDSSPRLPSSHRGDGSTSQLERADGSYPLRRHGTGDYGLPLPPSSRLSSLNYGRTSSDDPRTAGASRMG